MWPKCLSALVLLCCSCSPVYLMTGVAANTAGGSNVDESVLGVSLGEDTYLHVVVTGWGLVPVGENGSKMNEVVEYRVGLVCSPSKAERPLRGYSGIGVVAQERLTPVGFACTGESVYPMGWEAAMFYGTYGELGVRFRKDSLTADSGIRFWITGGEQHDWYARAGLEF